MIKDQIAIREYYKTTQKTEFRMCHFLNKNMPLALVDLGYFFEIEANTQYTKNDIVLVQYPPDRAERNIIVKVEYECGMNQTEWDFELPRFKWQALNLMTRKKYGETFELFIKSSRTFNSFFAIDCREGFVQKNFGGDTEDINHNLEFETNKKAYRIYWHELPKHQYIDDKSNKKLVNANICIIEDNLWSSFYGFLWRRFLTD